MWMLDRNGIRIGEFMEIDIPLIDVTVGPSLMDADRAPALRLEVRGQRRFG